MPSWSHLEGYVLKGIKWKLIGREGRSLRGRKWNEWRIKIRLNLSKIKKIKD